MKYLYELTTIEQKKGAVALIFTAAKIKYYIFLYHWSHIMFLVSWHNFVYIRPKRQPSHFYRSKCTAKIIINLLHCWHPWCLIFQYENCIHLLEYALVITTIYCWLNIAKHLNCRNSKFTFWTDHKQPLPLIGIMGYILSYYVYIYICVCV